MVPPYFPLLFSIFRNPNGSPNRLLKAGVISAQNIYSFGFGKVRGCHQQPLFAGLTREFPGPALASGPMISSNTASHVLPRVFSSLLLLQDKYPSVFLSLLENDESPREFFSMTLG